MAESNQSISEYPCQWDDEVGANFNSLGKPQTINFYYEGVLKFHHNREYNTFGELTRNLVVKDF
ncbi:MAG: hypothetical protein HQ522_06860 [Bacteroidetes bacterium]|nr:hypothetical protein [Bacteroidota bacterium]